MDTTDPMDIGDTMERDLLMKKLQLLDQIQMPRLILIMDTDTDITDHMDTTEDTMERDLLMNLQLLAQILMLMLMLGWILWSRIWIWILQTIWILGILWKEI